MAYSRTNQLTDPPENQDKLIHSTCSLPQFFKLIILKSQVRLSSFCRKWLVPLGSNAVEKNKAGTAFDSVLRERANCDTRDASRTVCSRWVLSTWKLTHFAQEPEKKWDAFEAPKYWAALEIRLRMCDRIVGSVTVHCDAVVPHRYLQRWGFSVCELIKKKRGVGIYYRILSYEAVQSFCRSGLSGFHAWIVGVISVWEVKPGWNLYKLQCYSCYFLWEIKV